MVKIAPLLNNEQYTQLRSPPPAGDEMEAAESGLKTLRSGRAKVALLSQDLSQCALHQRRGGKVGQQWQIRPQNNSGRNEIYNCLPASGPARDYST